MNALEHLDQFADEYNYNAFARLVKSHPGLAYAYELDVAVKSDILSRDVLAVGDKESALHFVFVKKSPGWNLHHDNTLAEVRQRLGRMGQVIFAETSREPLLKVRMERAAVMEEIPVATPEPDLPTELNAQIDALLERERNQGTEDEPENDSGTPAYLPVEMTDEEEACFLEAWDAEEAAKPKPIFREVSPAEKRDFTFHYCDLPELRRRFPNHELCDFLRDAEGLMRFLAVKPVGEPQELPRDFADWHLAATEAEKAELERTHQLTQRLPPDATAPGFHLLKPWVAARHALNRAMEEPGQDSALWLLSTVWELQRDYDRHFLAQLDAALHGQRAKAKQGVRESKRQSGKVKLRHEREAVEIAARDAPVKERFNELRPTMRSDRATAIKILREGGEYPTLPKKADAKTKQEFDRNLSNRIKKVLRAAGKA